MTASSMTERATALRTAQEPLTTSYRDDPGAALVTMRAEVRIGADGVSCSVDTGKALVEAGLHEAASGPGTLACSGDMPLEALVACAGVTVAAVATSMEFDLAGGTVHAEATLDFRGTLGVDKQAPVGFTEIGVRIDLHTDEPQERIDTLLELAERYCVVGQTIARGADLRFSTAVAA